MINMCVYILISFLEREGRWGAMGIGRDQGDLDEGHYHMLWTIGKVFDFGRWVHWWLMFYFLVPFLGWLFWCRLHLRFYGTDCEGIGRIWQILHCLGFNHRINGEGYWWWNWRETGWDWIGWVAWAIVGHLVNGWRINSSGRGWHEGWIAKRMLQSWRRCSWVLHSQILS